MAYVAAELKMNYICSHDRHLNLERDLSTYDYNFIFKVWGKKCNSFNCAVSQCGGEGGVRWRGAEGSDHVAHRTNEPSYWGGRAMALRVLFWHQCRSQQKIQHHEEHARSESTRCARWITSGMYILQFLQNVIITVVGLVALWLDLLMSVNRV